MEQNDKTRALLLLHFQKYPQMQIQDAFKYLYQSAFGCEHLLSSIDDATDYIKKEYNEIKKKGGISVESLDGEYSRVYLSCLGAGMSSETLAKIFCASAGALSCGVAELEEKLSVLRELTEEKLLPFTSRELDEAISKWRSDGYPAVHHSEKFRECYAPSYRVISNRFVPFLPLLAEIDKGLRAGRVKLAIEGGSASGKSTLGNMLEELYGATVFHMDDFFLRPEQRTRERYSEIGGNVDRERFLCEVLSPLSKGEAINYRRFDCSLMTLAPAVRVEPKELTVVEGAYSMHPELCGYYTLSVFLDVEGETQKARIARRNSPEMAERFYNEWIPLEDRYFSGMRVRERCDLLIEICD